MTRTKKGGAPGAPGGSRGNFTPPRRVAGGSPGRPRAAAPRGRAGRLAVRNWRVPTRLNAILLIPVLVALAFGGLRVQSSVETWQEAEDAHAVAQLVQAAYDYGDALLIERDRSAEPLLDGRRNDPAVVKLRADTDRAKRAFDTEAATMPDEPSLRRRLAAFREAEPRLSALREAAYTDKLEGVRTEESYTAVQHPLMEFANELGLGTGNVTSYGRSVYALALAKGAESLQRSIGTHLLVDPAKDPVQRKRQLTAAASYAYLERIALEEFTGAGRPEDRRLLRGQMREAEEATRARTAASREAANAQGEPYTAPPPLADMVRAIASGAAPRTLRERGITPDTWFAAATQRFDAYRAVEDRLVTGAVTEARQIAADARRDTFVTAGVVLAALLVALVLAALMARSMSRSMMSLRKAAFDVAEQRLPQLVDQLSRTAPGRVDTRVDPIPIDSTDEIGEVARAFDQVHREAVRLAAEQALLRGNVNAIFTNLSSRSQGLIERQLDLLTELQSREADPDQLSSLFKLDHLATRMRRNGENLLVLAGEEPGRRWTRPVPLVDVLRAAASEVEHYERITMSAVPDSEIHGDAVTDLVHLLSELLENATTFSAPRSRVRLAATRLPDGRVMVEIHDRGIGLTAEDFAEINHRLADPPTVDAAVSRRMGLFVVGRLAGRHGVRVQLRPSGREGGTTSLVMLPESLCQGGGATAHPEEDFSVSRIMPAQPSGAQSPGPRAPLDGRPRSAADLGFDDSRYDLPPATGHGPAAPGTGGRDLPPVPHRAEEAEPGLGYDPLALSWSEAESAPGVHEATGERVGFDRPGPSPSSYRSTTGAGLPRRDPGRQQHGEGPGTQPQAQPESSPQQPWQPLPQQPGPPEESGARWRSVNDDRWDRAGKLRDPAAGGVTYSGLPRRVPRANLVEGIAEQSPQGGPQVSRAPEDVRGRLSNLHRGVRRGRSASDAHQNDRQGYGPGSTYDQER